MKSALILSVVIQVIPHSQQRYDTVGDWRVKKGTLVITVSHLSDPRYQTLIAFHELVEAWLCQSVGVTDGMVDAFDIPWKPHSGYVETGDDPAAPYHWQHGAALKLEKLLAVFLRVNWKAYNAEIENL